MKYFETQIRNLPTDKLGTLRLQIDRTSAIYLGVEADEEVVRLKIKCNQYAKLLVSEGHDDVSWEVINAK